MPVGVTRGELLSCCASTRWAESVAAAGPFVSWDDLAAHALTALATLEWGDVLEALDAHPRIGDRDPGPEREAAWSRQEQAGVAGAADDTLRTLAAGNAQYERRFGHVFLICAAGKSAGAMLAELGDRLDHSPVVEREVVRAELAAITRLRLRKLAEAHLEASGSTP